MFARSARTVPAGHPLCGRRTATLSLRRPAGDHIRVQRRCHANAAVQLPRSGAGRCRIAAGDREHCGGHEWVPVAAGGGVFHGRDGEWRIGFVDRH